MLKIFTLHLGWVQTNTYIIADEETKEAVIIDPAWADETIDPVIYQYNINQICITHAHFDHICGINPLINKLNHTPEIFLHPMDKDLWQNKGDAGLFGLTIDPIDLPTQNIIHGQNLRLGGYIFKVLHIPGHSPGHVAYYCKEEAKLFCGDIIFKGTIGRTDLPRGDHAALITNIKNNILTLPQKTRLYPGHGSETTIGNEIVSNPFLIHLA